MMTSFQRIYPPAQVPPGSAYWLLFRGYDLLVQKQDERFALPCLDEAASQALAPTNVLYLGLLDNAPCLTGEVQSDSSIPDGWQAVGIRVLFDHLDDTTYGVVGYASQILRWQRESGFCPVCGTKLDGMIEQWMRKCPNCGHMHYPPVTPAILVLVHDGPRVLLAHKPGWGARYSVVAGFVEPGESLEQCAKREILEEVGVEVTNVRYIDSQPWPFPHQLMVGFMAEYTRGEIHPDQIEIDQAAWFRFDELPDLPPPLSLSRQLINKWVSEQKVSS